MQHGRDWETDKAHAPDGAQNVADGFGLADAAGDGRHPANQVDPGGAGRAVCSAGARPGAGRVTFQTIYPGWYRGRTVHIHLKVHVGGQEVHTSQMFFDDATSDEVFGSQPYAAHAGRDTTNATDSIFQSGGQQGLLALTKTGGGYTGTLTLGVQA